MDGNPWRFTYRFPSSERVYTKSPSNPIFSIQWTGNVTETARPTVRKPCIHESPVQRQSIQYTFTFSPFHLLTPALPCSVTISHAYSVISITGTALLPQRSQPRLLPELITNSENSRGCSIRYINLESYMAFLYDSLNRTDGTHLPTFQAHYRSSEPEYPSLHTTNQLNPNPHLTFYTRLL